MRRALSLLVLAAFAAGCSSVTVSTDYAQDADFSKYQTYAWHDSGSTVEDQDELAHRRIVEAVDLQLGAKGFRQVASNPDTYVTYYGRTNEQTQLTTTSMGYGYGPGWYWGGLGGGTATTTARTYTVGTLVVDIWDASARQLVWRGTASAPVSESPEKRAQRIREATAKMFESYPPEVSR